jgi:hypothetical protein
VKQGAVAQTALVKLAVPSLLNDVLCKYCPHELDLLIRKLSPAGIDGLPSAIERGNQGADGVRIKYAVYVDRGGSYTLRPLPWWGKATLLLLWRFGEYFVYKSWKSVAPQRHSAPPIFLTLALYSRRGNYGFRVEFRCLSFSFYHASIASIAR